MRRWIKIPLADGSAYLWDLISSCKHVPIYGANDQYIEFCVEDTCPFFKLMKGAR